MMENESILQKSDKGMMAVAGLIAGILFGALIGVNGLLLITAVMLFVADASDNDPALSAAATMIGALAGMCIL